VSEHRLARKWEVDQLKDTAGTTENDAYEMWDQKARLSILLFPPI